MTLILAVLCFGLSLMLSALGISGLSDFLSGLINKSKGCDKAHPSPFVRDYIKTYAISAILVSGNSHPFSLILQASIMIRSCFTRLSKRASIKAIPL